MEISLPLTVIIVIVGCIVVLLMLLLSILSTNKKKLKIENLDSLRKTFFNSEDCLVYLKDENLKYVFVNQMVERYYQKKLNEIIGFDDFDLAEKNIAENRTKTDIDALQKGTLIIDETKRDGKIYKTTKFPVKMINGSMGVGAYIKDVTEERKREEKLEQSLSRSMILVDVLNRNFSSGQEQLDYVLHKAIELTKSQFGYIFYYDEKKQEFTPYSWTDGVLSQIVGFDKQVKFKLEEMGIRGDAVRQRKPIIINSFKTDNLINNVLPTGHFIINNFMCIPVIIDDKIIATIGVSNKQSDYDENDMYEMTLLMNGVWSSVKRRDIQETLSFERNKYFQILVSIGEGVMVVDKDRNIEMLNPVAEKLLDQTLDEVKGEHYKKIFVLSHENPELTIEDPIESVFSNNNINGVTNHAILASKNGTKYCLENSAAPIKDNKGMTTGVVLVFRDVTEKEEQNKKIEFLSSHDSLTGLYNRRFFEKQMYNSDLKKDHPISIIMGDVNGLKLTNDVFGHICGDNLLKKAAEILNRVCGDRGTIARIGGDEFVALLPKTDFWEAEKIIETIKNEYKKEQIKAMKCSISMGSDTKETPDIDIFKTICTAEERMYLAKTLEKDEVKSTTLDTLIHTLHEKHPKEKTHSICVSKLCQKIGEILKLKETEIKKLKDAGYLHDIGKVVLNKELLNKIQYYTREEWNEIRQHPIIGYRILNSFDSTLDLAEIVLAHQERWDGSGYPKGLKGEEIPVFSRIISLAESYERKRSGSENLEPMSKQEALKEIRKNSGHHFDPVLTDIFIKMIEDDEQE